MLLINDIKTNMQKKKQHMVLYFKNSFCTNMEAEQMRSILLIYVRFSHWNGMVSEVVCMLGERKLIFCLSMVWLISVWSTGSLPGGDSRAFGVVGL